MPPLSRNLFLIGLFLSPTSLAWAQESNELPKEVRDPMFNQLAQEPELKEDSNGKWAGSLGLGVTVRRGSESMTQGSFSLDAERNLRESRILANVIAVRSATDGERSSDTMSADLRGERKLSDYSFGFLDLGAERDGLQDMMLRSSLSSGVGRRWLDAETVSFNFYTGLAYSYEHYRSQKDPKGFEPLLGSELRYELSETSRFTHRLVIYPDSISGGARYAMQAELSTRINSHFGLQLAVLQKYREKVSDENSHSDTVVFTGITAGF